MFDNIYGSIFYFFSLIISLRMSDCFETYSSAEIRTISMNDEEGRLNKSDSLFENLYNFCSCFHMSYKTLFIWYHPGITIYSKLFPRSGILREYFVSIDAGVIDAEFRGIIQILMVNHHLQKTFTVRTGDRIAQVISMEKFNANFHRVTDKHLLGQAKCVNDGFGSTGVTVIKKAKNGDVKIKLTTLENNQVIVALEENSQIIPEKSENEVQITSEDDC